MKMTKFTSAAIAVAAMLAACGPSSTPGDAPVFQGPRTEFSGGGISPQGGTITSVTPSSGGGLTGGGTSGPVSLGLLTSCSSGQVLAWSGTAWACTAVPTGSGTTNTIPVWTSSTTLGNSGEADNGTTFSINNRNAQAIRAVGTTFTAGNPSWDAFDTTTMAQGVGGSIIFEGNYTSGGSHTALGAIKALKDNSTSGDFGGDLSLGARLNGSGDVSELLRLVGPTLSILSIVQGGFYVEDAGAPTDVLRMVAASGQSYLESGTSTAGGATTINFTSMTGTILYGQFGTFGATVTPNVTNGGGVQGALRIGGGSTIATSGDAMSITFEQDTGGNYFTRILSQNTATSPSFLNPKLVFQVQGNGTIGTGNIVTIEEMRDNGSIFEGGDTNAAPTTNLASVEFFTGRNNTGALVNANQTVADLAFDYGGGGGGFRHWISTNHDTVAANNSINFWVNNSATAGGSSVPGTGNAEALSLQGDASAKLYGTLISTNATAGAERIKFLGKDVLGNTDNTNGPEWVLGVSTSGRRSIMLFDSAAETLNGTNTALDFQVGSSTGANINAVSTNWGAAQPLTLNGSPITMGNAAVFNNNLTSTSGTNIFGQTVANIQTTSTSSGSLVNDFALSSTALMLRWNATTTAAQWTGMAGGTAGRIVFVQNVGTVAILIYTANSNSLAANRFEADGCSGGCYLTAGSTAIMTYDGANSLWMATFLDATNTPGPLTVNGALTSTSNIETTGGSFIQSTGTTFLFGLDAASSGNQDTAIDSAGTGTIKFNSNTGSLANAGTGGLALYAGANGSTAVWTVDNTGLISSNVESIYLGRQVLTAASGTYTPTTGARKVLVRMVGGGGGGGGASGTTTTSSGCGSGGAAGSYFEKWINPGAAITGGAYASGSAGTGGPSTPGNGGNGGDTTIVVQGTTYTAKGGTGGLLQSSVTSGCVLGGGNQSGNSSGDVATASSPGGNGCIINGATFAGYAGYGGTSPFGAGSPGRVSVGDGQSPLIGNGGGGGGGCANTTASNHIGGAGTIGEIIVDEWR